MHSLKFALLIGVLSGCDGGRVADLERQVTFLQREVNSLEAQLEDVRSKLSDAESEVDSLNSAVSEIDSAIDEFGYTDWRTAVLSVQSAAIGVGRAANSVESSIDDAITAAR